MSVIAPGLRLSVCWFHVLPGCPAAGSASSPIRGMYAVLWRLLLAEGLIGSGQAEQATVVLEQLRPTAARSPTCSRPWPGCTAGVAKIPAGPKK